MMVSMATPAMLVVGMVVALRVTRAALVWMAPLVMLMIGMMLSLRVTRVCRSK